MPIHALTVKGVRNLLKHDFNFFTNDDCNNSRIVVVVDINASPFDQPIGYLVDIQLKDDDRVNLIIEKETKCPEKKTHTPLPASVTSKGIINQCLEKSKH